MADEPNNSAVNTDTTGAGNGSNANPSEAGVKDDPISNANANSTGDNGNDSGQQKSEQSDTSKDSGKSNSENDSNEGKKDGDGGEAKAVEYSDFKFPEGMQPNKEVLEKTVAFARELSLPQEKVQTMVDMGVKLVQDVQKTIDTNFQNQRTAWKEAIKSDKELGGQNFDKTHELVQRAIRKYGDEAELKPLVDAGALEFPGIVRLLRKVGLDLSEDSFEGGNVPPAIPAYSTDNLHPELSKKSK